MLLNTGSGKPLHKAFTSIGRYISRGLEAVSVWRHVHRLAISKLFWDQKLSLLRGRGILSSVNKVDRMPYRDLLRPMNCIYRRRQDKTRSPGPELSPDKLNSYADYYVQEFD